MRRWQASKINLIEVQYNARLLFFAQTISSSRCLGLLRVRVLNVLQKNGFTASNKGWASFSSCIRKGLRILRREGFEIFPSLTSSSEGCFEFRSSEARALTVVLWIVLSILSITELQYVARQTCAVTKIDGLFLSW